MFTLIRTIGGGPKNRMKQDGFNLDLTYITPRIIAMSFPSTGFQSIYRNDLPSVVQFLESRHQSNYMIVNVSNRKYDYQQFNAQIKDYFWPNHQTPQLKTLFEISSNVSQFLSKNQKNVVAFHCNHGKGRTGTAIISFLLFSGFFKDLQSGIREYNQKRFSNSIYQIDIPCQVRYLKYFQNILKNGNIDFNRLKPLKLIRIQTKGIKKGDNIFIRFQYVRNKQRIGQDIRIQGKLTYLDMRQLMIGDIKAKLYIQRMIIGESKLGWINFHTYFVSRHKDYYQTKQIRQESLFNEYLKMQFNGREIKINWGYSDVEFSFIFQQVKQQKLKQYKNYKQLVQRVYKQKSGFQQIQKVLNNRKKYLFKK